VADAGAKPERKEEEGGGVDVSGNDGIAGVGGINMRQTKITKGRRQVARFIAGEGEKTGGSTGGLLALVFAIENNLILILARRCVVKSGVRASLIRAAKFLFDA